MRETKAVVFSRVKHVSINFPCHLLYASYYVHGLKETIGAKSVHLTPLVFQRCQPHEKDRVVHDNFIAFTISTFDSKKKIQVIVDFGDSGEIDEEAYDWCDLYAKINIAQSQAALDKLLTIPPGFGIRAWTWRDYAKNALRKEEGVDFEIGNFLAQWKRGPLETFENGRGVKVTQPLATSAHYVFCAANMWPHANCLSRTNVYREAFMQAAWKHNQCFFEGGFYPRPNAPLPPSHLTLRKRYSMRQYKERTKRSVVVFNTPAVFDCHGWKLAEFLAMGKAIISTPLSNLLPEPLVPGEHFHQINSVDEIEKALNLIIDDHSYRAKLEQGAHDYYVKHVSPVAVTKRILQKALTIEEGRGGDE